MARVFLLPNQGMRLPGKQPGNLSDDEEGVQSGSATGFSDGEEIAHARPAKVISHAFDPVNRILDKIDAELSSLTHSQSSSTATDSTVVRMSPSHESTDTSRLDSGSLTISQLGSTHKPTFSPLSSGSKHTLGSDKDTGIGTATSSFRDSHHRSRSEVRSREVRDLEPGDGYKMRSLSPPRRTNSPDLALLNGHHGQSDDDKSKHEQMSTAAQFEAKQLDDKFKEIMQKRKGGFLGRASGDEDNQTIRTEDFADKFQDALVYPSSDEAERLKNIEEDLLSEGGWDTDTLQQKLESLTQVTQPKLTKPTDGRQSPKPLPRPQRRLGPPPDIRPRKAGAPGTPPVYPKPTPTNTLPRPSTRSSIKFTPGHTSDADSVRTEDFEHHFKDMMVTQGNQVAADSDADTVSNDPIHARVKELLKATAKYAGKPLAPVSNSILKSQLRSKTDKPKSEQKSKQHVRISAKPPQYQDQNEGDDSDDTLCSDKDRVTSPRLTGFISDIWEPNRTVWREPASLRSFNISQSAADNPSSDAPSYSRLQRRQISKSSSIDESLSKSSLSFSTSSVSSSDKDKKERQRQGQTIQRQGSQISSISSAFSSTGSTFSSLSDYTDLSKRSSVTHESVFGENWSNYSHHQRGNPIFESNGRNNEGNGRSNGRRNSRENLVPQPYERKGSSNDSGMRRDKQGKKKRDLIVQDEEEEEYPFAKYTFNKKPSKSDDSSSSRSTSSKFSSSKDSIHSIALLKQHSHLQKSKMVASRLSTTSLLSSVTSSLNESPESLDDFTQSLNAGNGSWMRRPSFHTQLSSPASYHHDMMNSGRARRVSPPSQPLPYNYDSGQSITNNAESMLRNFGLDEARSILPERFMKSWVDRVMFNKKSEIENKMIMYQDQPLSYQGDPYYVDDTDFLPPSVSAQQSGASTPKWQQSLENLYAASYQQEARNSLAYNPRSKFRRSQTFNSSNSSFSGLSGYGSFNDYHENFESEYSRIGALPLPKENSFDKLKQILQSSNPVGYKDRDMKRSRFASNRQKSLPIFLETLSEEEDDKQSKHKMDDQKRKDYMSNMKTFLEEEEALSIRNSVSSSDDTSISDTSRKSSGVNDVFKLSETMCSLRNSLDGDESECSIEIDSIGQPQYDNKMTLPSIFVSEKEVFRFDSGAIKQMGKGANLERPCSPNPDNQSKSTEPPLKSKDSLEVAEIMSPKIKPAFKSSLNGSLQENDDIPPIRERPLTPVQRKEKRNSSGSSTSKYLSITSERDDKHLSPTSSIASPLLMSPITVIEVKKLDNQNDSLEMEDHKDTDSSAATTADKQIQQSHVVALEKITETSKESPVKNQGRPRQSLGTPKELSLERRRYQCETNVDTLDSDDVFREASSSSQSTKGVDEVSQTEDGKLPAIIPLIDLNHLLQEMSSKLQMKLNEEMVYMAHDRGVQCDLEAKDEVRISQISNMCLLTNKMIKDKETEKQNCEATNDIYIRNKNGSAISQSQNDQTLNIEQYDNEFFRVPRNGPVSESTEKSSSAHLSDIRVYKNGMLLMSEDKVCETEQTKESHLEADKRYQVKQFKSEVFIQIGADTSHSSVTKVIDISKRQDKQEVEDGHRNVYNNVKDNFSSNTSSRKNDVHFQDKNIFNFDVMSIRNFSQVNTKVTDYPKSRVCSVLVHETPVAKPVIHNYTDKKLSSETLQNQQNVPSRTSDNVRGERIGSGALDLESRSGDQQGWKTKETNGTVSTFETGENARNNFVRSTIELPAKTTEPYCNDASINVESSEILQDTCQVHQSEIIENGDNFSIPQFRVCSTKTINLCFDLKTTTDNLILPHENKSSNINQESHEKWTNEKESSNKNKEKQEEVKLQNKVTVLGHTGYSTGKRQLNTSDGSRNVLGGANGDIKTRDLYLTSLKEEFSMNGDQNTASFDKNYQLSSRSLDYETPRSRKNILRLSKKTAFSQSIDVGVGSSLQETSKIIANQNSVQNSSPVTSRTNDSIGNLIYLIQSRINNDSSELNANVDEDLDEMEPEFYEKDQDNSWSKSFVSLDQTNIDAFQQKPRNCSLKQAAVTRFSLKSDNMVMDNQNLNDSHLDCDIDKSISNKGIEEAASDQTEVVDPYRDEEGPNDMERIFEEFDKLYNLSFSIDASQSTSPSFQSLRESSGSKDNFDAMDLIDEVENEIKEIDLYANTLNESETERYSTRVLDNFETTDLIEEIENETKEMLQNGSKEMEKMDMYPDTLHQSQTHVCRNCGYSATFDADVRDLCLDMMDRVEHDYCTKCSPLDITMEQLERQRLLKNSVN